MSILQSVTVIEEIDGIVYNLSNTTEPEEFNLHKKILSFNPVEII
jgi:hypothetical protein